MAWVLCDEPISAPFNYSPDGLPQITLDELIGWFRETATYLKDMDPNHLVTVSSQPAIQTFFGGTPETQHDYLKAVGIPEFDFIYTEDSDLRIIPGLTPLCTLTPDYDLEQFWPGKPVVFMPSFTSGCWNQAAICTDYVSQADHLSQAIQRFFEVGAAGVLIQNWGTDLYSSVPDFARCFEYTDSNHEIVVAVHSLSASINPDALPNSPLQFVAVPSTLSIPFIDVPADYWAHDHVMALATAGITGGCTAGSLPYFCPEDSITRGQMAVFIEASLGHPANACTGQFTDVPSAMRSVGSSNEWRTDGITGGCGTGTFCPNSPVTRGQMSVFIEAALGHTSTACTGQFSDVPAANPSADSSNTWQAMGLQADVE